jgi:hypothetical protein
MRSSNSPQYSCGGPGSSQSHFAAMSLARCASTWSFGLGLRSNSSANRNFPSRNLRITSGAGDGMNPVRQYANVQSFIKNSNRPPWSTSSKWNSIFLKAGFSCLVPAPRTRLRFIGDLFTRTRRFRFSSLSWLIGLGLDTQCYEQDTEEHCPISIRQKPTRQLWQSLTCWFRR